MPYRNSRRIGATLEEFLNPDSIAETRPRSSSIISSEGIPIEDDDEEDNDDNAEVT